MTTPTNLSDLIDEVKSLLGNPDDSTLARIDIPFFLADNNYNKYYAAHAICSRLAAQDLVQFPERESAYIALGLQILSNYNRNKRSNPSPSPTNITVDKNSVYEYTKEILEAGSNVSLTDDDQTETITIDSSGGGGGGAIVDRTTVYPIAKQIVVAGTDIDIATDNATETLTISSTASNVQSDWAETDASSDDYIKNKPTVPSSYAPVNAEANVQSDWNETDASSDDYIKNKPTVPTSFAPVNAEANVQSDWNETDASADDYIKNKPTVIGGTGEANVQSDWNETDASSDDYIKNKPTVPTSFAPVNAEANVQSDWNETDASADDYIKNKPTVIGGTGEANVQSDWNETDASSDDYIKNKPTVPTSFAPVNAERNVQSDWNETDDNAEDYIKNKPTVPTRFAPVNAQHNAQSDWNQTNSGSDDYIENKPTVPTSFAPVNAERNVQSDWNETDASYDGYIKNKPIGSGGGVRGNLIATWTFSLYGSYLSTVTLASDVPTGHFGEFHTDNTGNTGKVTVLDFPSAPAILKNQVGWWLVWEDKGVEQHSYFMPLHTTSTQSLRWNLGISRTGGRRTIVEYEFLQGFDHPYPTLQVSITDIKTVPDITKISDQTLWENRFDEQTVKLYPAVVGVPVSRVLHETTAGSQTYNIHPNETLFHVYKRKSSWLLDSRHRQQSYTSYRTLSFFRSLLIDSGPPTYFSDSDGLGCSVSLDANILTITNIYIDTAKRVLDFKGNINAVHAL